MLYNKQNGISPKSVNRPIQESLRESLGEDKEDLMEVSKPASSKDLKKLIKQLEAEMLAAVKKLNLKKPPYSEIKSNSSSKERRAPRKH